MRLLSRTLLVVFVLDAVFAFSATPPKSFFELERRSQQFTQALAAGNSWDIYHLFVPQFRAENSFRRFDSALKAWYRDRQIVRASRRVVEVQGLGGHASTWPYFKGEKTYSYVYQNWFYSRQGWQLVWLSNILNQSFQYGQRDTAAAAAIAEAALRYVTTPQGLAEVRPGLKLPETIVVVWDLAKRRPFGIPGRPVVALRPEESRNWRSMPRVPYYFRIATVRVLGEYATCGIDIVPTPLNRYGLLHRTRGAQFYFELKKDTWQFNSVGKKW